MKESLFHYRYQALSALKIVDDSLSLKDFNKIFANAEDVDDQPASETYMDPEE